MENPDLTLLSLPINDLPASRLIYQTEMQPVKGPLMRKVLTYLPAHHNVGMRKCHI
jgi:hypothetical protein